MKNNRYLILGDLHCRTIWKDIVAKESESCDKIIFLGDYTVPREVILDDPTDACGFLYDVLDFKDKNSSKVILLRGNHDLASSGYYWATCNPKDHPKVEAYWQTKDVKRWFLRNTQWVYQIPNTNIICSHAGISTEWLGYKTALNNEETDWTEYEPPITIWDRINRYYPSEIFAFTGNNPFDTSGESETQPCTWIRPYTLLSCGVKDIIHVVGHTPTKHICNLKEECKKAREKLNIEENAELVENYCDIWCCDCLANKEYLIIEDGKFKQCKL